jgi:hypothetical protein
LAALDATIQLTDTTTEGATIALASMTKEWLGEHGYVFGNEVAAPWVWNEGYLILWFESELPTDLENVWGDCSDVTGNGKQSALKLMIDGQLYILREDGLYNMAGMRVK